MKQNLLHILIAISLLCITGYIIVMIDPEMIRDVGIGGSYSPLMISLMLTISYLFMLILDSWKRGFFIAMWVVMTLYLGIGQQLSLVTFVIATFLLTGLVWLSYYRHDKVKKIDTFSDESGGNI